MRLRRSCRATVVGGLLQGLLHDRAQQGVERGRVLRRVLVDGLVEPDDRTDTAAYAGVGLRGYLTNRFLLQAEYRQFVVFTSRDDNEEIDEWTVGFTYFF